MPKGGYKAGRGRPRKANSRRSLIKKGLEALAAGDAPECPREAVAPEPVVAERFDPLAYMLRVMNDVSAEPECPAEKELSDISGL